MAKNGTKQRGNNGKTRGGCTGKGWEPGESGNPNGRPKSRPLTDELKRLLAANDFQALKALMAVGLRKALKGDYRYWQEILNRIDGKVLEALDVTTDGKAIGPDLTLLSPATKAKVLKEAGGPQE